MRRCELFWRLAEVLRQWGLAVPCGRLLGIVDGTYCALQRNGMPITLPGCRTVDPSGWLAANITF